MRAASIDKKYVILILLFCFFHGLLLLDPVLYADDWSLVTMDAARIGRMFREAGSPWAGYVHLFLLSLPYPIAVYKFIVFTAYLMSTLLFFKVLSYIRELDPNDSFIITALFAVFPANFSRTSLIVMPYAVCHLLFFAGFLLLCRFIETRRVIHRLLSLTLFFISFLIPSFLVFYVLPLTYIAYKQWRRPPSIVNIARIATGYIDYLILPAVYWVIKMRYFKPYGFYGDYNVITAERVSSSFLKLFQVFETSFIEGFDIGLNAAPMAVIIAVAYITYYLLIKHGAAQDNNVSIKNYAVPVLMGVLVILSTYIIQTLALFFPRLEHSAMDGNTVMRGFLMLVLICALAGFMLWKSDRKKEAKKYICLFFFGLFSFCLGAFPYLAVGLMPSYYAGNSRHQLLMPLGAVLMVYYLIKLAVSLVAERVRIATTMFISSFLIVIFGFAHIRNYINDFRDWYKQVSIIENFRENDTIAEKETFAVVDTTKNMNTQGRDILFFEYIGMLSTVYPESDKLAANDYDLQYAGFTSMLNGFPFLENSVGRKPTHMITISSGGTASDLKGITKLFILSITNRQEFNKQAARLITMSVHPLDE